MAENDTHYNDTPGENTQTGKDAVPAGNDYGLTTPLPDFEEGGPVYPDNIPNQNDSGRPVIPLPDFEEGGPVYPDSNMGPGPVIPLPFPGEGGPVYRRFIWRTSAWLASWPPLYPQPASPFSRAGTFFKCLLQFLPGKYFH